MIVVWLLRLLTKVGNFLLDLLPSLPTINWPAGFNVNIPIPGVSVTFIAALNTWFGLAIICVSALLLMRVLLFAYRLIPFNG